MALAVALIFLGVTARVQALSRQPWGTGAIAPPSFLQTRRSEAGGDGIGINPQRELPENYKIFIHDLPSIFNEDLLDCYKNHTGMSIWEDDSKERAQNAGDVWLHKALLDHPRRTTDPTEATTFLIPFYGFLSSNLSGRPGYQSCNGLGHWNRTHRLAEWLKVNPHFKSKPEQHVVPISYWAVARKEYPKWDDELFSIVTGELYELLQKVRLLVYEPRFGSFRMEQEYTWWKGALTTIPYVASMSLISAMDGASDAFSATETSSLSRRTKLYFRGNTALDSSNASFVSEGQKVRRTTFEVFGQVAGARIEDSSVNFSTTAYLEGMTSSTFCLVPKGDTPTSRRLFDAIVAGCIPIIVSDEIYLPFDGFLDWGKFAIKVQEKDVLAGGKVIADYIDRIPTETIQEMQVYLRSVRDDFIYGRGTPLSKQPGRCIDNILLAIARAGPASVPASAEM